MSTEHTEFVEIGGFGGETDRTVWETEGHGEKIGFCGLFRYYLTGKGELRETGSR